MRAAYKKNPEPYKERAKAAYAVNPELWKANVTVWQNNNRDKVRLYKAKYTQSHIELKRETVRRREARLRAVTVARITIEALRQKIAYWGDKCWVCGGVYEAMDHVKPLAKGGAHVLANLRPICTPCNTRKRDRWPLETVAAAT